MRFLFLFCLLEMASGLAWAAPPPQSPLPPLEISASIAVSGQQLTLTAALEPQKVQMEVSAGGSAAIDTETVAFEAGPGGGCRAGIRLDGDPGRYTIRAFSRDKEHRQLTLPATVLLTGLRRDAGVWRFNGSPWIEDGAADSPAGPAQFLTGLQRSEEKVPRDIELPDGAATRWRTLEAPSLQELLQPQYDWAALDQQLGRLLAGAHGVYVGVSLPARRGRAS
jgi:hypothetical protein